MHLEGRRMFAGSGLAEAVVVLLGLEKIAVRVGLREGVGLVEGGRYLAATVTRKTLALAEGQVFLKDTLFEVEL